MTRKIFEYSGVTAVYSMCGRAVALNSGNQMMSFIVFWSPSIVPIGTPTRLYRPTTVACPVRQLIGQYNWETICSNADTCFNER